MPEHNFLILTIIGSPTVVQTSFFSPPMHLCVVTYMAEILSTVTKATNKGHSAHKGNI